MRTILEVTVKASAKHTKVEALSETAYRVCVNAAPQDGKANRAVIEALADHFKLPKSSFSIIRGETNKKKWIEIAS